jgi:filamentous hemagglutinin family protein
MIVTFDAALSTVDRPPAKKNLACSVSAAALSLALGLGQPAAAQSLPTGGAVVSGNVAIARPSPSGLTITQSSPTGIVNWSNFSIGQGYQVQFNNGAGATLNRVTGNVPSSIDGRLSATGSVYLVNPAGIAVGPTGVINTGGSFVASTLDVKDADFSAGGSRTFSGDSGASITNLGKIGSSKGDVVLIARQVRNDGSLTARNGTVAMASGGEVVLSDSSLGNGKVLVRLPTQSGEIKNSGAIRAAEVELRANGGNIYALAGNTGRTITATGIANRGGRIFLTAQGGSVTVTQKIVARRGPENQPSVSASAKTIKAQRTFAGGDVVINGNTVSVGGTIKAKGNGGAGGTVVVTGTDVTLTSAARIDASGTSGGTVLIGGDRAGGSDAALRFLPQAITNARTTTLEAGAMVTADGTSGAGGNVVVWSDGTTSFAGIISAKGSRGGFIETSGHQLNLTGGSVNAGRGGTWLLDPVDLTIDSTLAGTIASTLNAGTNVIQQTTASGSGGSGDITVASAINWSTDAMLTLSAYRNIAVNSNITSDGGGAVALRADNTGTGTGTVSFGGGQLSTAGAVSIFYNPTAGNSTVNPTQYTSGTQTNFSSNVIGGATLASYMLVNNVYDLQNMQNGLSGKYALGRDIDASVTSTWNAGNGFAPVGFGSSTRFLGSFDGQGHTISGLTVNRPANDFIGLFGYLDFSATVGNVGLVGGSFSGRVAVGALAGENYGAILQSYATGAVTSNDSGVGGLVGYNHGSITRSYATGAVTGAAYYAGGLAGFNGGSIAQSYATGAVTAPNWVGGLVGSSWGSISQSYATGAVSGTSEVGGLVGHNESSVFQSYATGAVSGTNLVGGLVGNNTSLNANTITQSYWDSYTTGQAAGLGGGTAAPDLTAVTSDPTQSASANYAFTQSAYGYFNFTPGNASSGWFMVDGRTRPFGQWEYSASIANAHQLQLMAMNRGASYTLASDIDLSGGLGAVGGRYPGMWSSSGFAPIGNLSLQFTGSFDGQGHAISNLAINLPSTSYVGLFGYIGAGATVSNLGLQAATVTGAQYTGGLAGFNNGTISNVSISGAITGTDRVGGLVGKNNNNRSISNASAAGTVTVTTGLGGGLVGENTGGTVSNSSAAVTVLGTATNSSVLGGLVGWNNATTSIIQNSYATGSVTAGTGSTRAGGLAGQNYGKILKSYATGNVTGGNQGTGGLVGYNNSIITQSYATGTVNAAAIAGGLVGVNSATGTITQTYATGAVTAPTVVGGLAGGNVGSISQSYWDTTTSGRSVAVGSGSGTTTGTAGLTTSQMQDPVNYASTYVGWDFATVWSAPSAGYYPQLYGVNYVLRVNPANASRVYGDANSAFTYSIYGLHAGDTSGIVTGLSLSTAATSSSNVGAYAITASGGSAVSASGQNYRFIDAPGTLTVTPRSITVTADAKNRAYGNVNPSLTYQVGGSGLVNGDTLSGALATAATATSNVGVYGITQGTLAASPNYTLASFTDANLAVMPRAITVTAEAKSRAYGNANPSLTYQVGGSGLVNGDTLSGALATAATAISNVGAYGITQGTLAASPNYTLASFAAANLAVTPRPITVTADGQTKVANTADPALTYRITSGNLVGSDTLAGWLLRAPGESVGAHSINQGMLAATPNYALTFLGAPLTITASPTPTPPPAPTDAAAADGLGSYVKPLTAWRDPPQPPEPALEAATTEQRPGAAACESGQCLPLPHPHNRQVSPWIRFINTMIDPVLQSRIAATTSGWWRAPRRAAPSTQ